MLNLSKKSLERIEIVGKEGTKPVLTDEDGFFTIKIAPGDSLHFSGPGYIGCTIAVRDFYTPVILAATSPDIVVSTLKQEAAVAFLKRQLPETLSEWEIQRHRLRSWLLSLAGITENKDLPLDYTETGIIQMKGYSIKKIYYQTRPGVYATANLYVPDGKGPFPAVLNMHGHWENGKTDTVVQSVAHQLALNGYVCLTPDAWGAGERTTVHGLHEYHGASLGGYLLNLGESLLGQQVTDNMRAVDLLCSLAYVDKNNIGATGASGGGNQTMWVSAIDDRIKAAIPVVSVGTFQSCVAGSNCICELMPQGLQFTEESGVLALIAPRALKIFSALQEQNNTFLPAEMLRSFTNAKPIFSLYNATGNLAYELFNTPHGYFPAMRQSMIAWFDHFLNNKPGFLIKPEVPFQLLSREELQVFKNGNRDPKVMGTYDYCMREGKRLAERLYTDKSAQPAFKRADLKAILLMDSVTSVPKSLFPGKLKAGKQSILLQGAHIIPLTLYMFAKTTAPLVIICSGGKNFFPPGLIAEYSKKGYNVIVPDLWGVNSMVSPECEAMDSRAEFHTLSRSELWLGHTMMGKWINDIDVIVKFIDQSIRPASITIDGFREAAVATLFRSALRNDVDTCVLRNMPISFVIDRKENIDFFNMATLLPGILKWGDISLAAALSNRATLFFINPLSITGNKIVGSELEKAKTDFKNLKKIYRNNQPLYFNEDVSLQSK